MVNLVWNEEDARKSYIEQGKEQGKIEVATNLLKEKMSLEFIAKITGLSSEKILKIAAEIKQMETR